MELIYIAQEFADKAKEHLPSATFMAYSTDQINKIIDQLALSDELIAWYTSNAPLDVNIPLTSNDLLLYDPKKLIDYQFGYRWHAISKERLDEWPSGWLVIGDIGADPLIAHTDKVGTPISGALHGIGEWIPRLIAPNLAAFLQSMAVLVDTFNNFPIDERYTDDDSLRPEVLDYIRNNLRPILAPDLINNFLWFRYG